MISFPIIDYAQHPAFKEYGIKHEDISVWLEKNFKEIDGEIEEFYGKKDFSMDTISTFVKEKFTKKEKEITLHLNQYYDAPDFVKETLSEAVFKTFNKLNQEVIFNSFREFDKETSKVSHAGSNVFEDLDKEGISVSNIPIKEIKKIRTYLTPYITKLQERRQQNPYSRCAFALPLRSLPWNIIMKYFKKSGFLDGGAKYYGYSITPMGFGLELSHEDQTWWKNCYEDVNIPTSKTVYMHNDYDFDYIKAMVYLDEVDVEKGAFSYVKGSHQWKRDHSLTYMNKEVESLLLRHPKFKSKSHYYRRTMKTPFGREIFASLPKVLQRPSHFGDDILDNTQLSKQLLEREFWATSDKGNFVLFTGGNGIHRGGNVHKGERIAIQITISKTPILSKKIRKVARDIIGKSLSTLIGEKKLMRLFDKTGHTF